MGLFSALLPKPAEVKQCLSEMEALQPVCARSLEWSLAYDLVSAEAKRYVSTNQDEIAKGIRAGKASPRTTVLLLFMKLSGHLLAGGEHHIYRGVLSAHGKGLLVMFDYANDELVKAGYSNAQTAEKNKQKVRQEIQEVG